jgi:Homing endonuclease associated repeat
MARSPRYTNDELLAELVASARRLGRSPTMAEFRCDPATRPHPQTLVTRFGSWNGAKRRAGLVARRFATKAELVRQLQELGEDLGRIPTGADLAHRRGSIPSKSLYWQAFGSLRSALEAAGFDVPGADERRERAIEDGVRVARGLGRLPSFEDWGQARRTDQRLPSEWQVYRLFGGGRGAWAAFLKRVERRLGSAASAQPHGRRRPVPRALPEARGRSGAPRERGSQGGAPR